MVRKLHLKADKELAEIGRQLSFSLVNPENTDTIKKRFLRRPYEPEFDYAEKPDTAKLREQLEELKCGRTKPGKLLDKEREHLLAKCAMVEAIGTPEFGKRSAEVYGTPSKELLERAKVLLELEDAPKDEKVHADEMRGIMKETFKLLGFTYALKRVDMVSSARVSPGVRQVQLKKKERFGKLYAYRLAVHEIATHALRAENGREQSLAIFARGTPGYLEIEEGFAAYNEERAGVMTADILRNYAGRVYAVHLAEKHTFVETYQGLRKYFKKQMAFKLALRAKRGMGSGEQKGACTKDHLYLKGYLAIKDYVAQGGSLTPLYAAKIGLGDLEEWGKRLEPPKYIAEPVIEWVRHEIVKGKH